MTDPVLQGVSLLATFVAATVVLSVVFVAASIARVLLLDWVERRQALRRVRRLRQEES